MQIHDCRTTPLTGVVHEVFSRGAQQRSDLGRTIWDHERIDKTLLARAEHYVILVEYKGVHSGVCIPAQITARGGVGIRDFGMFSGFSAERRVQRD